MQIAWYWKFSSSRSTIISLTSSVDWRFKLNLGNYRSLATACSGKHALIARYRADTGLNYIQHAAADNSAHVSVQLRFVGCNSTRLQGAVLSSSLLVSACWCRVLEATSHLVGYLPSFDLLCMHVRTCRGETIANYARLFCYICLEHCNDAMNTLFYWRHVETSTNYVFNFNEMCLTPDHHDLRMPSYIGFLFWLINYIYIH